MRLYLSGTGDYELYYLDNHYNLSALGPITVEKMKEKFEHNTLTVEIASTLMDVEYNDIKNYDITKEMWEKLALFYGGD